VGESERDVCGFFTRDLRDCIEIFVASGGSCRKNTIMRLPLIESYEEIKIKKGESASRVGSSIRLDGIIRTNCIQITTNSIELRFDESSRTSLTGLSVLLSNEMFIFTLMNPLGSGYGRSGGLPQVSEGDIGIGFEYVLDLNSVLSTAMSGVLRYQYHLT